MKRNTLTLTEKQPVAVYAAIVGALTAVVHVLVVTGVIPVDAEQAVAGAVDAVGALVLVVVAARAVTPNAKVVTQVTTDGDVVAGDASTVPTGRRVEVAPSDTEVNPVPVASAPVNPLLVSRQIADAA